MFLGIRELALGPLRFEQDLTPEQIGALDGAVLAAPVHVTGQATVVEAIGQIRVRGTLTGALRCECDRCLEPFEVPANGTFDLLYEPAGLASTARAAAITEEDAEVGYYEGEGIELADVVREQLSLSLPMQRLCRPECQGICPTCGADRNEARCQCKPAAAEQRWAALKNL
jgi:uncharacterized protein